MNPIQALARALGLKQATPPAKHTKSMIETA
jgi:hypothetical protein